MRKVAIVLSVCLLGNTLHAGFIDGLKKGWGGSPLGQLGNFMQEGDAGANFSNITNPSSDGDGGYYGGSIEFKIDANSAVYQPWVQMQEPKASASCNAMTLEGGFVKALGLEDIAEQLGNATGALVYGLFIALVNSLPSIEHVFSGIKRMIQTVQNMLANACNFGQSLGNAGTRWLGGKTNWGIQSSIDSFDNYLNGKASEFEAAVQDGLTAPDSWGTNKEKNQDEANVNFGEAFKVYDFTSILAPVILQESRMKDGQYGFEPVPVTGASAAEIIYLFAVNMFGAPNGPSGMFINFVTQKYGDGNTFGKSMIKLLAKGKLDDAADKGFLTYTKKGSWENKQGKKTMYELDGLFNSTSRVTPAPMSPKKLVNQLLNGGEKKGQVQLYKTTVLAAMAKNPNRLLTFLATDSFDEKSSGIAWKGLREESKKIVKCLRDSPEKKKQECKSGSLELIVPGAMTLVNTVVSLDALSKRSDFKQAERNNYKNQADDLAKILADLNAYYAAQYFLEYINAQINEGTVLVDNKGVSIDQMVEVRDQLKQYMDVLDKTMMGNMEKLHAYKEIFSKADSHLQELRNAAEGQKSKTKGGK